MAVSSSYRRFGIGYTSVKSEPSQRLHEHIRKIRLSVRLEIRRSVLAADSPTFEFEYT